MLNSRLIHDVAFMLAATRSGQMSMGKLTACVYGSSAQGQAHYSQNTKTLAGILADKGYVQIIGAGKRNQSVMATLKGLEMIKDYEGWDEACQYHDDFVADGYLD